MHRARASAALAARCLALALALGLASGSGASAAPERRIPMRYIDQPLGDIVADVARALNERFIYDDQLAKRVTIAVSEPVTHSEAFELLHTALMMAGLAAVPAPGGGYKIFAVDAAQPMTPWAPKPPVGLGEQIVTTRLRLESVPVEELIQTIRPLLDASTVSLVHEPSNSLIIGTTERRLGGLLELVQALDSPDFRSLVVRRVRHRDADEIAQLAREAYGAGGAGFRAPLIVPDARTSQLVIIGSQRAQTAISALIDELDRPFDVEGEIHVIPVHHVDAEALAAELQTLASGDSRGGIPGVQVSESALQGRHFSVVVDSPTNALVVQADPETAEIARSLVRELDRPAPRVAVDVLIAELSYSDSLQLSLDALVPLTTPKSVDDWIAVAVLDPDGGGLESRPSQQSGPDAPSWFGGFSRPPLLLPGPDGIPVQIARSDIRITARAREFWTTVLMNPSLIVANGEEHEIFAGNNIPIPVQSDAATGQAGNSLVTDTSIERQDVGVRLRVRPRVGEEGGATLVLNVEFTQVAPSLAGSIEDVGTTLRKREVQTTIPLQDGEIAVIGTAEEPRTERSITGIPYLMNVPWIGWAFRATSETKLRSRFLVAVQARVLRSADQHIAETIVKRVALARTLARTHTLLEHAGAPYAVRVATTATAAAAEELAFAQQSELHAARVVSWVMGDEPHYDVYLLDFETFGEAADEALRLHDEGFVAQVIPLERRIH